MFNKCLNVYDYNIKSFLNTSQVFLKKSLKKVHFTGRKKRSSQVVFVAKIVFCFISNNQRIKFNFCPVFCLWFGLVGVVQKGRSGSVRTPEPERETERGTGRQGATGRAREGNPQEKAKKSRKN